MRRLLFIIAALLLLATPAYSQASNKICFTTNGTNCAPGLQSSASVPINVAAATTTQLIALVANKQIFVTSYDFMANGTQSVTLKYGTGSSCGTGTTSLTGPYPVIAQAGISKGNGTGAVLFVPPGNALCITTSGSSQVSGSVSYVQF